MKTLLILFTSLITFSALHGQKTKEITGTVSSEHGPLAAVVITSLPSKKTTITDANGKFQLKASLTDTHLQAALAGYEVMKLAIGKRNVVNFRLNGPTMAVQEAAIATFTPQTKMMVRGMANSRIMFPPRIQQSESYANITENGFKNVATDALSTFSIDVDAASYSNIRRFINGGNLPPKDAIRIEEMINYFDYNYEVPKGTAPVNIVTEIAAAPWNKAHRLVHIGLKAKVIPNENLPASNFVFLIDVSGSMYAQNKLPLLISSLRLLTDNLREKDKVAIVVYAGSAGVVLPSTSGSHKQVIKEALSKLQAGGSTAGGAGIKLAYKIAKEQFIKNGNNRIILATDGDFNIGASSDGDMQNLIEEQRKSGVFLTTLGFGMGNYKDSKMETLANKGNGNYAYIDDINEARKVLINEFGGSLFTVAKDVKLQVEFNPNKVQAYRLIGYENRLLNNEDFDNDQKDAGEMGAGHTVTALYEIIPTGVDSKFLNQKNGLKYQKNKAAGIFNNEVLTVKMRYKKPDGDQSKLLEKVVTDNYQDVIQKTSENLRFSSAVAMLGMLLRQSEFTQESSFEKVIALAEGAKGLDKEGYRAEFIKLARTSQLLAKDLRNFTKVGEDE